MEDLNNPEIVNALAEVAGANSLDVVGELADETEMDEFSLAERLGMDVKTVRKILYRLYDSRLVNFRRIKDAETGWYIYLWKFEDAKLTMLVHRLKTEKITKLREKLEYESENQFFICENGCVRVTFGEAMEAAFVCKHCGSRLDFSDNASLVKQLKSQLKAIEKATGS